MGRALGIVLNIPSIINDEAIDCIEQVDINHEMNILPEESEVKKATKHLSSGKAPGADAIPAEVYKAGGTVNMLTELFQSFWHKGQIPKESKDASITHLYKRKGNCKTCENHSGISLLSFVGKILARVLLNQLNAHLEQDHLPESKCSFRKGSGTVDMIFAACQLQEKMPGTEEATIYNVCQSYQGLQYC